MNTPRHRGEAIDADLCWKGWKWETLRHQVFTAKGPYYRDQAAEASFRAQFYADQIEQLTGVGVD